MTSKKKIEKIKNHFLKETKSFIKVLEAHQREMDDLEKTHQAEIGEFKKTIKKLGKQYAKELNIIMRSKKILDTGYVLASDYHELKKTHQADTLRASAEISRLKAEDARRVSGFFEKIEEKSEKAFIGGETRLLIKESDFQKILSAAKEVKK